MTVGSICSGISADSVAWKPLGWKHVFYSEIDKYCSKVLRHYYPEVPNYGDFTAQEEFPPADILVVSTPCQDFSVAGLRAGMDGARGSLTLHACRVIEKVRSRWIVFENVPGILQGDCAVGFHGFLSRLAEIGYGFAYATLDAQYFSLAQRRERVFLVGYIGDWRPAAAVLFDLESLSGHPAPSREEGQDVAHPIEASAGSRGYGDGCEGAQYIASTIGGRMRGQDDGCADNLISHCINGGGQGRIDTETETETETFVVIPIQEIDCRRDKEQHGMGIGTDGDAMYTIQAMRQHGVGVSGPVNHNGKAAGSATQQDAENGMLVPFDTTQITSLANRSNPQSGDPSHPLTGKGHPPSIAFTCKDHGADAGEISPTLRAMAHSGSHPNAGGQVAVASAGMRVRRLTVRECEALQGFPPDFTLIPEYRSQQKEKGEEATALYEYYCRTKRGREVVEWRNGRVRATPDGSRYRALGNSIAVPVLRWIGDRITMVESML